MHLDSNIYFFEISPLSNAPRFVLAEPFFSSQFSLSLLRFCSFPLSFSLQECFLVSFIPSHLLFFTRILSPFILLASFLFSFLLCSSLCSCTPTSQFFFLHDSRFPAVTCPFLAQYNWVLHNLFLYPSLPTQFSAAYCPSVIFSEKAVLSGKDIYRIVATITPLYVAMILAYACVRIWKIFTPQQCAGISKYVATFAVPILSFHMTASCNFYDMNYRFLGGDTLQKVVVLALLILWLISSPNASLEWVISFFALSTLPNTLVIGIPLLQAMYGDPSSSLMVQIVVLQALIWYTLLLILYEYRAAVILISEHLPDCSRAITSIKVDPDVVSLGGNELLEADAEMDDDGKVHVVVRISSAASMGSTLRKSLQELNSITTTPRASDLSGVEIYSLPSFSRTSSLNKPDGQYGSQKHRISGSSTEADWIVEAETTRSGERSYRGRKQLGA